MIVFHWSDYLVFVILLLFYAAVGIYFKVKYDSKLKTNKYATKEYFLANQSMGLLPVAASILVSFLSAISILGTIAEVYLNGIEYACTGFSYFFAFTMVAYLFLPTFYKLELVTVHQYLEMRFNKVVRVTISILFVIQMILYMSVVIYAPSLAFSQVSGLDLWISILTIGIVCTFYTALGGMRAVIWTDTIQFLIIIGGMLLVITFGIIKLGGASEVWTRAVNGNKINLFDFNPNPLTRHTFWTLLIGGTGMCLSIYATNQAQVQRYLSCKTLTTAKRAVMLNIPITFVFLWLQVGCGLVVYATFANCDPLAGKEINKADQIFPYFVMKIMSPYYPIPGLFLSTIFAAALSTVSSGINSLSNVIIEDLWLVWYTNRLETLMSEKQGQQAFYSRLTAVIIGIITMGLAFIYVFLSSTVLQIALSLFGAVGGPILATFSMGLFVPCINSKGVLCGLIACAITTLWLGLGSIFRRLLKSAAVASSLNSTVAVASALTSTASSIVTTTGSTNQTFCYNQTIRSHNNNTPLSIYDLSYLYYTFVAVLVCFLVSLVVSAITGFNSQNKVPLHLLHAYVSLLCRTSAATWMSNQVRESPEHTLASTQLASNEISDIKRDLKTNSPIIPQRNASCLSTVTTNL